MNRVVVLLLALATAAPASAQTYWLGRKPDPKAEEYVFDVAVPADLAAAIACSTPNFARLRDGVKEFQFDVEGKTYTFIENTLAWDATALDRGSFAFLRDGGVDAKNWATVSTAGGWKACKDVLLEQKKPAFNGDWSQVTPIMLKYTGAGNPNLKVNFNADAPFAVTRHPGEYDTSTGSTGTTKKPQIVPVIHKGELYVAWQTWDRTRPTGKVIVSKVALSEVGKGKLTAVREVPSGGTLVGFTVDAAGADYVLTAKAEQFENRPMGDFLTAIHNTWRKDVMVVYVKGTATDINSDKYTDLTFYGIGNSGTGRLASGANHIAALFARRRYAASDNLVHQEADALLVSPDLARVSMKAENRVSHSFDQRLIFDGTDFVSLHQGDQFPVAGLIIEKLPTGSGGRQAKPFAGFTCPSFGNDVYFELGGLAAEKDGYPVLFSATRNMEAVSSANAPAKRAVSWDLAMTYVVREFDKQPRPKNPFDVIGSGILAKGFGKDDEFTVDNFSWNAATSDWTKREARTFTRRVEWLTDSTADKKGTRRATAAKLVQLGEGKYVAVWEQHLLAGGAWKYDQTFAVSITITGDGADKQIKKGQPVAFKNLRLHRGDDAVALPIGSATVAGWVTAGATNKQLLLHTLDADLKYKAHPLQLP